MRTFWTLCLTASALAPLAIAQQPPAWSELSVPAGVDPAQLQSRGKLITYREANTLHVFSAVHRRWQSTAAPPAAPTRLMNDCVLLRDGTTWTAFSVYSGQFAPLTVSPNAQLLNPSGQNNDSILLVLDGNTLHAFSCFVGTWNSRTVTATTGVAVLRHVAVLSDGTLVSGMDAYSGQWHDTTVASPPQVLDCDGVAGFASDATHVHAFSAAKATWQTSVLIQGALFARGDDWGVWWGSGPLLGYSGLEGGFSTRNISASGVPVRRDLYAIVDTPAGLTAYSAIRSRWGAPMGPPSSTIRAGESTAILVNGLLVTGYSAAKGAHATIALQSSAEAVGNVVATAVDNATGQPWCYSGLLNTWHQPPLDVLPGLPQVTATSILLPATSGAYAFSARTGNFVLLAGSGIVLVGNDQSAVAAAWDSSSLHAFDARTDTWHSIPRSSPNPPILQIWRTSLFATDGTMVHGFGAQSGAWSSTPLPEPYLSGRANSESSRVVTATHILGHSPVPVTLGLTQFPEFRRAQPIDATARFSIALDGGGIAVLAGGLLTGSPTAVAGLGEFWLASPIATSLLIAMTGAERATFDLAVPLDPALRGLQLGFQSLAIPASGPPHLGEAVALYVL